MAKGNSPESPPLKNRVRNQIRIGIGNPLDPDISDPKLILSPVAGNHGFDNFLGLFYRVDLMALEE